MAANGPQPAPLSSLNRRIFRYDPFPLKNHHSPHQTLRHWTYLRPNDRLNPLCHLLQTAPLYQFHRNQVGCDYSNGGTCQRL